MTAEDQKYQEERKKLFDEADKWCRKVVGCPLPRFKHLTNQDLRKYVRDLRRRCN